MKHYCKCGELIAEIKNLNVFSTFGRRTWLEGMILKIKCKKCREITGIDLKKYKEGQKMRKLKLTGVKGNEILLIETENKTVVEIEKMVSFLPFNMEQTKEFLKKIGIIK